MASTLKHNLIVEARGFHGNLYDDENTLSEQLEEATILIQDSATKPSAAFVDQGYRVCPGCAHRTPGREHTDQRAG